MKDAKKKNKTGQYIANGRFFKTYPDVLKYAEDNNFRVSSTETIRGKCVVSLESTDFLKSMREWGADVDLRNDF